MRRISGLLGALALAMGVAACGGGGGSVTGTGGGGGGGTCPVGAFCMGASSFAPAARTVPVGTTVTWQNSSGIGHNVVWDDATGRTAAAAGDGTGDMPNFDTGTSHTRLFNTAGTFAFHCTIHLGMTGTLTVQ